MDSDSLPRDSCARKRGVAPSFLQLMAFNTPVDEDDVVGIALQRIRQLEETDLNEPLTLNTPSGPVKVAHLPLMPCEATTLVRSVSDVIQNYREPLQRPDLKALCDQKRYTELPEALQPRRLPDLPHRIKMSLVVQPTEVDENNVEVAWDIVKHFEFDYPIPVADAFGLCHGEPKSMKYLCPRVQESKKAFHYLLEGMGGLHMLWHTYTNPQEDAEDKAIDDGFDFIEREAVQIPAGGMLRWITKWTNKKKIRSPICGWAPALVEKAIKGVKEAGNFAQQKYYIPITLCGS